MRLRRLFVSLFLALGQFYVWLAVVLRWLAKRLEQTAVTGATPEPAQQQPPAHWMAHVRREPPADWLDKVRQGAPQLLDPQLQPSRPPAPPPPPAARPAGHRPPPAAARSRARPLKQVRFRLSGPAATQPDKQSPPVTPVPAASPSAAPAFAGPPGSAPDTAEAADDGPPLPEGRPFPQAAFPEADNQSEPAPATAAPPPERSSSQPRDGLNAAIPAAVPAAPEAKLPVETAASRLKQSHHRTLMAADFPRPTPPGNEPDESRLTEEPAQPALPVRPLSPPHRQVARAFREIKQQPANAPVTPVLEEPGTPSGNELPLRPPDVNPAVRADYWPPLAETAAPNHKSGPKKKRPIPAPPDYPPGQRPNTVAGEIPPEVRQPLAGKPITADLWPALPDTFLDDMPTWEDDLYTDERRQRLDFEQRGPEWNE